MIVNDRSPNCLLWRINGWNMLNCVIPAFSATVYRRRPGIALSGLRVPLKAKNASKIIYRAMKDKPEILINTNMGTWDLKERIGMGMSGTAMEVRK
jgi:hypothetical protein